MTLRAVIFDFGGVFTTSPVSHFATYERENGLPQRFMSEVIRSNLNDGAFARFERAELTLDEFDAAFAAETRAAGHEVAGRTLVSLLKLDFRPDMIAALKAIKDGGLATGCITNNMPGMHASGLLWRGWFSTVPGGELVEDNPKCDRYSPNPNPFSVQWSQIAPHAFDCFLGTEERTLYFNMEVRCYEFFSSICTPGEFYDGDYYIGLFNVISD